MEHLAHVMQALENRVIGRLEGGPTCGVKLDRGIEPLGALLKRTTPPTWGKRWL
jgi:hypothetical protein